MDVSCVLATTTRDFQRDAADLQESAQHVFRAAPHYHHVKPHFSRPTPSFDNRAADVRLSGEQNAFDGAQLIAGTCVLHRGRLDWPFLILYKQLADDELHLDESELQMSNRDMPRERVTSFIEPQFFTHRARGDKRSAPGLTRGTSRGRPRAHGITSPTHCDTGRLRAMTPSATTQTRCPPRGSHDTYSRSHSATSISHCISFVTLCPSATTPLARGPTLRTY